jgi:hypothetical protein
MGLFSLPEKGSNQGSPYVSEANGEATSVSEGNAVLSPLPNISIMTSEKSGVVWLDIVRICEKPKISAKEG